MKEKFLVRTDCAFYKGDTPCLYHVKKGVLCGNCAYYIKVTPKELNKRKLLARRLVRLSGKLFGEKKSARVKNAFKILIIKFGATGDVLRTTPILRTLTKKHPSSRITWVAKKDSLEILEENPYIDELVEADLKTVGRLFAEKYDLLLSLDKEPLAIAFATAVMAYKKLGFRIDDSGGLNIFNNKSYYALRLGVDNKLKFFDNTRTYQDITYGMAELGGPYGPYVFDLDEKYSQYGRKILHGFGIRPYNIVIGLNTGAGDVFLTKKWPAPYFEKLALLLGGLDNVKTVLLGGRDETGINKTIAKKTKGKAINIGTHYSKKEFAGIVDNCDIIVSSDSLAMHLGVAFSKKIIALFGPTQEKEVDLYGLGRKIFSGVWCSPCYKRQCSSMACMKSITPGMVFREIKNIISGL